ncbi:MAG TPA: hypothetical protein VGA69_00450 [Nitriliruptorales bacterium]
MVESLSARDRKSNSTARSRAVDLLLVAALVIVVPAGAHAHEADPLIRSVVTHVTLDLPGLVVQVGRSVADQLLVTNPSSTELEILDGDGRAFLRIGPEGVLGDLETAAFHLSNDPFGIGGVPPDADGGEPRWGRVSREPSWGWFDHRLHPVERTPPADVEAGEVLARWSVPIRAAGQEAAIQGQVEYRPPLGSYRAALDGGPVSVDGVTATILDGPVPAMVVQNDGSRPVVVLGAQGEPFLRVTPRGVDANLASPTWHDVTRLEVGRTVPGLPADASAPPAWEQVAAVPRIAWLELRAHVPDMAPADPSQPSVARRWTVPLRIGDREIRVAGTTSWVPVAEMGDGRGPAALVPVVGLVAAVLVTGLVLRLRRSGQASASRT